MTDTDRAEVARHRELAEAASAAQRHAAASAETARQEAWAVERSALALRYAAWNRHCEDTQTPHIANPPLPMMAPDWYRTGDGLPVEHEARIPSKAPAASMSDTHDVLGRPYAGAKLEPTPEQVYAAAAKAKRGLFGGRR